MYVSVWEFILNLAPGLGVTLTSVVSDFERAIINSVCQVFPGVITRGCWFHFCQALYKKWRKLGLTRACRSSLWMTMAIPLAPEARFGEGLETATAVGNEIADEFPAIIQFFRYVRRQWTRLSDVVSVGRGCETFHRHIVGRLGGNHPNICIFLGRLDDLISMEEINWQRVHSGRSITRGRTQAQVEEDARIIRLQEQLSTGGLPIEQFLREIMGHRRQVEMDAAQINDH